MLSRHPILSLGTFSRPMEAMAGLYKVSSPKKHPRYPMCLSGPPNPAAKAVSRGQPWVLGRSLLDSNTL